MTGLVVIVPSRGRPEAAAELAQTFAETCTADTLLLIAFDRDDPRREDYLALHSPGKVGVAQADSHTMVECLNAAAAAVEKEVGPYAIGFMGDDHRPRTVGWDAAYIDALGRLGTGIVYGDDLFQHERLPTQCAMTSDIVRALGFMAPFALKHMYVDNFWLDLGKAADCIRYMPEVVVEHMHPIAGKADWDEGHLRVNDQAVFNDDYLAYHAWADKHLEAAVLSVQTASGGAAGEWKLKPGAVPYVSTADFHADRERAPHLEQAAHRPRLLRAAELVVEAAGMLDESSVSDLGCGDGGLLSLIQDRVDSAWGYDFQPTNAAGWSERGVKATALDVFGADRDRVIFGDITVVTEVLEHIADPHGTVKWIAANSKFVVASSPWVERPGRSCEEHAWAWDMQGYRNLFERAGLDIIHHEQVGAFQLVLARAL